VGARSAARKDHRVPYRLEKVGLKEVKPTPGRFLFEPGVVVCDAFAHGDDYVAL
jgi:hypothetical protein